jgi:hypothetical protein
VLAGEKRNSFSSSSRITHNASRWLGIILPFRPTPYS